MDISKFLSENVIAVTGCTEPAAIAFATSAAYQAFAGSTPPAFSGTGVVADIGKIIAIDVMVDRNVYKNAASAIIPGLNGLTGISAAAAAGVLLDPRDGINLLSLITPEKRSKAIVLAMSGRIGSRVKPDPENNSPDICVTITALTDTGIKTCSARICGRHDQISEVVVDDTIRFTHTAMATEAHTGSDEMVPHTITSMIQTAESMDPMQIDRVYEGIAMNMEISRIGRYRQYGLGLGKNLRDILINQKGHLSLVDKVRIATADAADARMGGAPYPVMSTAGSGNQGITALVPLGVIGQECRFSKAEIARAALISHMVTKKASQYTGSLSALCGCSIKAGIGATAGITYLIGGGEEEITTAINLLMANVTGTLCDGAKPGCSLKISTAAGVATECAFLATGGLKIQPDNGIIQKSCNDSMRMLERIAHAMIPVDRIILAILEEKASGIPR